MARSPSPEPTNVELEILAVLWKQGPVELGAICQALREVRPIATTTVATMLGVMIEKGLAKRSKGDKGWRYSSAKSREQTTAGMVQKLVERAFDGSAGLLVSHLIENGELSSDERRQLLELLSSPESKKPGRRPKS